MSEFTEYAERLNMREQLARIDQAIIESGKLQAEGLKLAAEQQKLQAEAFKLAAERGKLDAEALKLRRDRFLAPALALAAMLGAIATVAPTLIRWLNLKLGVS